MKVEKEISTAWPKETIRVTHNNVELYIYPTADGICVNSTYKFNVDWANQDEQFEVEFLEPKVEQR